MSWSTIGEISLNCSMLLYFIWFIPQLMLTFKHRVTSTLSLSMHSFLVLGYLADLVYGFGQQLPLQYRLVTMAGLSMLAVAHYQFWRYNRWQPQEKKIFQGLTVLFVFLFLSALYQITRLQQSALLYNAMGALSWFCWLSFMWPQCFKNITHQSTTGLSAQAVLLSLFSSLGDLTSAFALAWAWPSKIGPLLGLVPKCLLLMQCYYYRRCAHAVSS